MKKIFLLVIILLNYKISCIRAIEETEAQQLLYEKVDLLNAELKILKLDKNSFNSEQQEKATNNFKESLFKEFFNSYRKNLRLGKRDPQSISKEAWENNINKLFIKNLFSPGGKEFIASIGIGFLAFSGSIYISYKYLIPRLDTYLQKKKWTKNQIKKAIILAKIGCFIGGGILGFNMIKKTRFSLVSENERSEFFAELSVLQKATRL